ncbi:MAG TPA: DNA translocase FtsK, partial [Candidatus Scatomorpha stercoravium]|nr:DNA translocase FtsK [Candidatus Scatomorpha stercoravium]
MANSTGGTKKSAGTAKKNPPSRARQSAKKPAPRPIRREVGAVVCGFLGIFSLIGWFGVEALFIDVFCGFLKGLLGWGYFIFPISLLASAYILATHRGRPVALRVSCAMLLPLVIGAAAHMLFAGEGFGFDRNFMDLCETLYVSGTRLASGGLLAGLISMSLVKMFSVFGAIPVLLVVLCALIMGMGRITPAMLLERWRGRSRAEYEPEPEPERPRRAAKAPKAEGVPERAEPRRRKNVSIDVPMDDEPDEDEYVDHFREYTPPAEARARREAG